MSEKHNFSKGIEVSGVAVIDKAETRGFSASFVLDDDGNVSSVTLERVPGFVRADGRLVMVDGREDGRKLGEPITASLLRRFRFAESLAAAKRTTRSMHDSGLFGPLPEQTVSRLDEMLDRRRGTARLGDHYYAEIAALYSRLVADGSRSATAEIAHRLKVSDATARNHVRAARDRGLLVPKNPGRGRQVGELTPKAVEFLGDDVLGCTGMPAKEED